MAGNLLGSPALGLRGWAGRGSRHRLRQFTDEGPAVPVPGDGGDLEVRAAGGAVVGVEDEVVRAAILKDGFVAGSAPVRRGGGDDGGSAAFGHQLAVLRAIRAGEVLRTANHDV